MKRINLIIALVMLGSSSYCQNKPTDTYLAEENGYFTNLKMSSQGLVFTNNFGDNIYQLDEKGHLKEILHGNNAGRYMSVSENGELLGYKIIEKNGKQHAVNYNFQNGKRSENKTSGRLCGVTDMHDTFHAWTDRNILKIQKNGQIQSYRLPGYINLVRISPDGKYAAFASDDKMHVLNLANNRSTIISRDEIPAFYPQWSQDSRNLLYVSGDMVFVFNPETGTTKSFRGTNPSWKNNQGILFQKNDIREMQFYGSELYLYICETGETRQLTNSPETAEMNPIFYNGYLYYHTYDQREIIRAKLENNRISGREILFSHPAPLEITHYTQETTNSRGLIHVGTCPYVHQLYDTPGFHNGNGSCAPTTSTMALAFYNRVPEWPTEVDHGYSMDPHTSNYGSYVADKFRYNETYFDAYSSEKVSWGAYSHMWVTNTSPGNNGMYSFHDIMNMDEDLFQDWTTNVYYTDITDEIDEGYVFPVCSWITMSGHLTLTVGYLEEQHTIVFNDPWGDKNTTGYPSYDGQDSYYDWPGYNNGFENLDPDGSHGGVAWTVNARTSEPEYNDTIIDSNFYGHGFHMNNSENSSHQRYFHDYNGGYGNHFWYTITMDDETDIASVSWTPNLTEAGNYEVFAYIPSIHATATNATYQVTHAAGNNAVIIDQSLYPDEWVSLGEYTFNAGQEAMVYLGDNTGVDAEDIAFDAMWWSKTEDPVVIVSTDISCHGDNNGSAGLIINDTHTPHSIEWSTGDNTESITGLPPGEISVTVTNALDQSFYAEAEIFEPEPLSVTSEIINPLSEGSNDGSIELFVSGGTPPYEYQWSTGSENNPYTGLSEGDYGVSITDTNDCIITETIALTDDCEAVTNLSATDTGWASISVSWTDNPDAGSYIIQYRESGTDTWSESEAVNSPLIINGLTTETDYEIRIAGECGALNSAWQYTSATTGTLDNSISYACSGIMTDSGGENGEYGNYEDYTFVIEPAGAEHIVVNFYRIEIEADWDTLFVYDGNSVSAPLITYFTGDYIYNGSEMQGKSIISTGSALCFYFKSDNLTTEGGWLAEWTSYGGSCTDSFSGEMSSSLSGEWASNDFTYFPEESDDSHSITQSFNCIYNTDATSQGGNFIQPSYGYFIDQTTELLSGWQLVTGNWGIDNNSLYQSDESESNTSLYYNINQSTATAYLYEMDISIDGTGTNRRAGFHFACDNPAESNRGNSYMIYLRPDQNELQLYEYIDNSMNLRCFDEFSFDPGITYNVKVIFDKLSGKISAYIDDQLVSSWIDSTPIADGNALSLRTGNALTRYQNIKIYTGSAENIEISVGDDNTDLWQVQNEDQESPSGHIDRCIVNNLQHFYQYGKSQDVDYSIPSTPYNLSITNASNDTIYEQNILAEWSPSADQHSGISDYEISIGNSSCTDDILPWQSTGNQAEISLTDLSLINGNEYYINVRSVNGAGLISECLSHAFFFEFLIPANDIKDKGIHMYPNPATSWLNIESDKTIDRITIINEDGKTVFDKLKPGNKIPVDKLSNGEYEVIIELNHSVKMNKKLIIIK